VPLTLHLVSQHTWRIYAIADAKGETFLDQLDLTEPESAKVAATLTRVASGGPTSIPQDRNHLVDAKARLYQLRVDECRILWFYDEGRLVICCHAYRKKSNKAPPGELAKGAQAVDAYAAAKIAGALIFKDQE
jgi:phage-related protein